jgi:hypothetical protein
MISKYYYTNIRGKNILSDYVPKDISNYSLTTIPELNLENMIINSNLNNSDIIK